MTKNPDRALSHILYLLEELERSCRWSEPAIAIIRESRTLLGELEHARPGPDCKECGKSVGYEPRGRPRLFCGDACRQTHWRRHKHDQGQLFPDKG